MQTQPPVPSIQSTHSRWLAITHCYPSSHSSFLYGVKSTKIYCRPTCPARIARRANVVFYDTEDQARRAGFRPCKRCKPDVAGFIGERQEVVTRVIALLRTKNDDLTVKRGLKELAEEVGVTTSYLCRAFKKTMGVTVGAYIREFERETGEAETESVVQSPNQLGSGVANVEIGHPASDVTARVPPASVEGLMGGVAKDGIGDVETLDLNFNLDALFWDEDFMNGSIYPVYSGLQHIITECSITQIILMVNSFPITSCCEKGQLER